jgi:hypothetical protein
MSMYLLGIIRMERERVEKAGVEELMGGVQGMGIGGGKAENLEKRGCGEKMEEKSEAPHAKPAPGSFGLCHPPSASTSVPLP